MYLINQDHDQIIIKTKAIAVRKHYHDGKFYGYNLYHSTDLLGTFDRCISAVWQKIKITLCVRSYYIVGGYYRCEEFESLYDAIREGIRLDMRGAK